MIIQTKKCDACGVRHESDNPDFDLYAWVELPTGWRREICPACMGKLFPA